MTGLQNKIEHDTLQKGQEQGDASPELDNFLPPSFPLEGELEVGVEGMEEGL